MDEKIIFGMVPALIVNHNFESEANKKMSNDKVWELIMKRSVAATIVVEEWSKNIPLANRKQ